MADDKAALIAEIAEARARISKSMGALRRDADLNTRFKNSFAGNKTAWLGGAGVAGWLLSRLPARKKKIYIGSKPEEAGIKKIADAGLILGILKFVFTLFRPAITAFATRKIADLAAKNNRW